MLYNANIDTLVSHRNDHSRKFFRDITLPASCLHYLLPTQENNVFHALGHLQNTTEFTPVLTATVPSLIMPSTTTRIEQIKHLTNTHTEPYYGSLDFVRDNPGEPVAEDTFTH